MDIHWIIIYIIDEHVDLTLVEQLKGFAIMVSRVIVGIYPMLGCLDQRPPGAFDILHCFEG